MANYENQAPLGLARGDSKTWLLKMRDKTTQEAIPFVDGDTVYFSVKGSIYASSYLLQKVITTFTDGAASIVLAPTDTDSWSFGVYHYDVQLTKADGSKTTIIEYSDFEIRKEVTND